jgi:hypothetical protein
MKKYTYVVLKSFWIVEKNGKNAIALTDEDCEQKSKFVRNTQYHDYEFPDRDLDQSKITDELIHKGYIKLLYETKL